ncbi:MAG: hypothetical protein V4584_03215 [Verrucomicrobiota bacterium]
MSEESEKFDEDSDNPFDLLASFGWHTSEQEGEDEEEDEDDWDDDVYWANAWIFESSLGDWGQFASGLTWDGSRDLSDEPYLTDLSDFDLFSLVLESQCAARCNSSLS